ncbi:MAG: hypothetical protein PHH54_05195 [Candidatus Nanoarchaeia archaeon]|nr:hypothetical protein [Candidatus Nanoarchaeia archaeon]MDD5741354.1 hypothetical protein [Candidatus Nanoarchaeia archaeon]
MYLYDLLLNNEEMLKILFTVVVGLSCFIIVLKTNRLFRLSDHQGIRYFRNAFFFYGLAFVFRYLFLRISNFATQIIFEFFIIMAGFFLLYSLIWKKFETQEKASYSSLFNIRILLFYVLVGILAFLDYMWASYCFMFGSQIILFAYASIISYLNYKKSSGRGFTKLYFIVMLLNLIIWIANFATARYLGWYQPIVVGVYALNIIIFLIFLYGVVSLTRK